MKGMWYCDTQILMAVETIIIIIGRSGGQGMVLRGSANSGVLFQVYAVLYCTYLTYVWLYATILSRFATTPRILVP